MLIVLIDFQLTLLTTASISDLYFANVSIIARKYSLHRFAENPQPTDGKNDLE